MGSLDSGWALIIGAAIALIGSVAAPWLKDAAERKHIRARELREEQRQALIAFQGSVVALLRVRILRPTGIDLGEALGDLHRDVARMQLCLPEKDAPIGSIVDDLTMRVSEPDLDDGRWNALGLFRSVTSRWYRREIGAGAAVEHYNRRMAEIDATSA